MPGDYCFRMQKLDFIKRLEPLVYCFVVTLCEIKVSAVIDAISCNDQADGRHVKRSGLGCIGMAELHDLQLFALDESFGRRQLRAFQVSFRQKDLTYSGLIWS